MSVEQASEATWRGSFHSDPRRLAEPSEPPPSSRPEAVTRAYDGGSSSPPPPSFRTSSWGERSALLLPPSDWCVDADVAILTLTTLELWEALERGEVAAWMRVWREGMECWTPVGEIPEFAWAVTHTPGVRVLSLDAVDEAALEDASTSSEIVTPPPESEIRGTHEAPDATSTGGRWIAFGSAVAVVAIGCALWVSRRPAPPPMASTGATLEAAPARAVTERIDARPVARAFAHEERGQRRASRGGRIASNR